MHEWYFIATVHWISRCGCTPLRLSNPRCAPRCGSLTLASARACGNLSTRVILRRVRAALDVAKSGAPRAGGRQTVPTVPSSRRDGVNACRVDAPTTCSFAIRQVDPHRLREGRRRVSVGADRSDAAHPAPVCGDPLAGRAVGAVAVEAVEVEVVAAAVQPLVAAQSLVDSSARPIVGRSDDLGAPAPRRAGTGLRRWPWPRPARSPATPRSGCWSPGCTRSERRLPSGTWRWRRTPLVEGSRTGAGPGQRPAHALETVSAAPSHSPRVRERGAR